MITTNQLRKAADMRTGSKMSWEAIADVLGVETAELVQAVEKNTGKTIPRETWAQPLGVVRPAAAPYAPAVPQVAEFIEGFPVVFDAGPPPPKLGDGRMAVLAQKLRPGAMVSPMKHAEFLSLRRCLTKLGMGSEFRWIDQKAGTVRAYVLAELSPRQKSMAVLMQAKAAAGKAMGRPKKRK
jgi:hypothetical protein